MRVLVFGEAMLEFSETRAGAKLGIAGDSLNTAIYLKRRAPHIQLAYLTHFGSDGASKRAINSIKNENIETRFMTQREDSTIGAYLIETDAKGERSFSYWRDNSAARRMFQTPQDFIALEGWDLIYFSAISLAILSPVARNALLVRLSELRADGCKIAFDSNYRPRLWENQDTAQDIVTRTYQMTDIALPSVDDEAALFGDENEGETMARLQSYTCPMMVLKRGAAGPKIIGSASRTTFEPAQNVVDTTAAGDSFNGGFLGAYLSGATPEEALFAGHALACRVIGYQGAILPKEYTISTE